MRTFVTIVALLALIAIAAQPAQCDEVMINNGDVNANADAKAAVPAAAAQPEQRQVQQHKQAAALNSFWQEKKQAVAPTSPSNGSNPLLQNCVDLFYDCTFIACCLPGLCCPDGEGTWTCLYPTC